MYTLHTEFTSAAMFCDESQVTQVHSSGRALIESMRTENPTLENVHVSARQFLELHGTVIGSGRFSPARLALYNDIPSLTRKEVIDRLSRLLDWADKLYQGMIDVGAFTKSLFGGNSTNYGW